MLEKLALAVGQKLKQQGWRLATVESCTGGGLSYWLTSIAGSSAWFERGFITYTRQAKIAMVGVNPLTLDTHGEVSEATVKEMAAGGLNYSEADLAIAITGIAGPDGGSPQKPVGTVWIAWAKRSQWIDAKCFAFHGTREEIRLATIEKALEKILTLE